MKFDKKNKEGQINFVLLKDIGKPVYDQSIDLKLIRKSFKFLNESS
jgi:3-dehydroquinate synthase